MCLTLLARSVAVAVCAFGLSLPAWSQQLKIHHINVQQGTSILVLGPDGTTVLMDGGKNGKGTAEVIPYLASVGILPQDGLDYTISSHLDSDHIGGMDEVLAAGYDVSGTNWFNGSTKTGSTITAYKNACAATTAGAVVEAPLGGVVQLGDGATLTFVAVHGEVMGHGVVASATGENDQSIAVVIEYGGFDYIWAGDLGGGGESCTDRSTSQADVETPLAQAITPGGGFPILSAAGVDVLHINHHGSESSTNSDYMNLLAPELAVISVGAGQSSNWYHPREDVVENVLRAQSACVTASAALVLQTEEGDPTGSETSFVGFCVGDIVITTDGVSDYHVTATGAVSQGPDERGAAGLPLTLPLDEAGGGGTPSADPWINELHYDNDGGDVGEFVEVAGPAGLDLTGWRVLGYNGSNGEVYSTVSLGGTLPDQGGCIGTLDFSFSGMQNGAPDGLALVDPGDRVVEFLSYEGSFQAASGPASGMTSTNIGVAETTTTSVGFSLQLGGTGSSSADFAWQAAQADTPGQPNVGQTFEGGCGGSGGGDPEGTSWINEFHYDDEGADSNEFVEIAGPAGLDVTGWQVVAYNGNGGGDYDSAALSGTLPNDQGAFGTVSVSVSLQNGSPDAIALVDAQGVVVQFLSYEGVVQATSGPASGLTSTDVGVAESGSTPNGHSLQLGGAGSSYDDFTWQAPQAHTRDGVNAGQTLQ